MKNKSKPKALSHTFECRSVITAEQAETCPLCRVRVAGPELLESCMELLKIGRAIREGKRSGYQIEAPMNRAEKVIAKAGGKT